MVRYLREFTSVTLSCLLLSIISLYVFDLDGINRQHSVLPKQLQPFRPLPIRLANSLGYLLDRFHLLPIILPLDEKKLIHTACSQAQTSALVLFEGYSTNNIPKCPLLDDNNDVEWRVGFKKLLHALEKDSSLTLFGRYFASQQIGDALKRRALVQYYWLIHHEWKKEIIKAPIFIVGLPRTGTTFLQELLGQDESLRTTKMWELMEPVPPPPSPSDARISTSVMNRISQVQWNLDQYKRLAPGLDAWHPIHSLRPEECILTLASTFDSQQYSATYPVKSYNEWLHSHKNHTYAMNWHKKILQTLQSSVTSSYPNETKRQWVLKTPYYLPLLDDIRKTYPDALIIHTHRNPEEVLASSASVHAKTFGIVSDDINLKQIGQEQINMQKIFLSKAMNSRKKWAIEKNNNNKQYQNKNFNVIDVHLKDLQQDTIKEIKNIFNTLLGRKLTDASEALMKKWLKLNKRNKHGTHTFNKKDFHIQVDNDELFKEYKKQFQTSNADDNSNNEIDIGEDSNDRKQRSEL
jgi:hypothetical protein